ncbi:MAG: hypothetical protein EOP04_27740, partial [Proteobacteria bacterium]
MRDQLAKSLRTDVSYPRLKRFVIEETGLHYFEDKDDDLCERISRRLEATYTKTADDYLNLVSARTEL